MIYLGLFVFQLVCFLSFCSHYGHSFPCLFLPWVVIYGCGRLAHLRLVVLCCGGWHRAVEGGAGLLRILHGCWVCYYLTVVQGW